MNNIGGACYLKENLLDGYAYGKGDLDEQGNIYDFTFLEVDDYFTQLAGFSTDEIIGKKATEIFEGIENSIFKCIREYGKIAEESTPGVFHIYFENLGKWYELTVISEEDNYYTLLFKDISALKAEKDQTQRVLEYIGKCQEFLFKKELDYHFFTDSIREIAGAQFVALNIISDEDKSKAITMAVSGDDGELAHAVDILGFELEDAVWEVNQKNLEDNHENCLRQFNSFFEKGFYNYTSIKPALEKIETDLMPGEIYDVIISYDRDPLGFLTIIMPASSSLENKGLLEHYIRQIAATIKRFRMEQELYQNMQERKILAEEKIHYMNYCCNLTGLYNRHFMEEKMEQLEVSESDQTPISLIMADVNGLKLINDKYGQKLGNEALQKAAELLLQSCRKGDYVARWGGDEFLIMMPKTVEKKAKYISQKIRDACTGVYIDDIPVTISLGVAVKIGPRKNWNDVIKEAENDMYTQKLSENYSKGSAAINVLIKILEEKSYETEAHTRRMHQVALAIAKKLKLSTNQINRLKLLITLHDIGKINIPEDMLTKAGKLTEKEWQLMKEHPTSGYRIACATGQFEHVAEEILGHHERWDGSGYPRGLKGDEIPLLSRITAIADAFEVMTNGRPYKKPLSLEEAIKEVKRCAGTQFDPALVKVFLRVIEEDKLHVNNK